MQYYRCKCGNHEAIGSMPPYPCSGCPDCGTNLSTHPDFHHTPEPHDFSSVKEIETDQGPATITRCQYCLRTAAQIEKSGR